MIFQIALADKTIEIHSLYQKVYNYCRNYVISKHDQSTSDIIIVVTKQELECEKRIRRKNNQIEDSSSLPSMDYLEVLFVYRKIALAMLSFNTFLMHGAVVSTKGIGYMFTAPSGVGKTTRTHLWIQNIPDSIVVNGDKPLIKVTDESVFAYGTPWCGKEGWNNKVSAPLKAIYLIERADSDEDNMIERISFADAFYSLLMQTYRPNDRNALNKTLKLLKAMDGKVRFYRFRGTPTAQAVQMAYDATRI